MAFLCVWRHLLRKKALIFDFIDGSGKKVNLVNSWGEKNKKYPRTFLNNKNKQKKMCGNGNYMHKKTSFQKIWFSYSIVIHKRIIVYTNLLLIFILVGIIFKISWFICTT